MLTVPMVACGGEKVAPRTDVPELAVPRRSLGRVVALAGEPEGLALECRTGTLAVVVRNPDGVALADLGTGAEQGRTA